MKLLFAQGNPGLQYQATRHNTGFLLIDEIATSHKANWKLSDKFNALTTEVIINGEKLLLVKPQSFYNDTGLVARRFIDFYKINPANDLLVIHDDLSLPLGTIRIRKQGSDAGNNGIKSLNTHIGEQYHRLRVGIWNEHRDTMDDADFVLSKFNKKDAETLLRHLPDVERIIDQFVENTLDNHSIAIT